MNIVSFSFGLEGLMFVKAKKVLERSEDIKYISSDEETLKYKINLRARLPKSLEDLRQAEAIIKTGDVHVERTFGNIMSAANAEISAIEDPLFLTLKDNLLTIQKTTILDPESTEFEMMFFYLKNHVIELMRQLFAGQFDFNKVRVEIREERIEG
jgi:hypothetical protein